MSLNTKNPNIFCPKCKRTFDDNSFIEVEGNNMRCPDCRALFPINHDAYNLQHKLAPRYECQYHGLITDNSVIAVADYWICGKCFKEFLLENGITIWGNNQD